MALQTFVGGRAGAVGSLGSGFQEGVRASMVLLPGFLQRFLTYLTGKPLAGQKAVVRWSPMFRASVCVLLMVGSAAGQAVALIHLPALGWPLLVPYWVLATGFMRRLQVVYAHHAAHNALSGARKTNEISAEILTTIGLIQNGAEYKKAHVSHHKRVDFSTERDIGAKFLLKFGFFPGMDKSKLWNNLLITMISPEFHYRFLQLRLISNFVAPSLHRRFMAVCWLAVLLGVCWVLPWWTAVLVIAVPMILLYQISTLLNTVTEHAWLTSAEGPADMRAYAERCWARFSGEPCPDSGLRGWFKWVSWVRWWLRMLLLHLPTRIAVFVGDTPAHDWHHLAGYEQKPLDWPLSIYNRERAIAAGKGWGMEKREIWGLWAAIDHSFGELSNARGE